MYFIFRLNLLAVLCFLVSCGATPYQCGIGKYTGGYTETQMAPDTFRVVFAGNGFTPTQMAQDFATLRAAELALEKGFGYFVVVSETTLSQAFTMDYTVYKPESGIVVKFFKVKPDAIMVYDAAVTQQSIKQKYKLK